MFRLTGGLVFDAESGTLSPCDLSVVGGRISDSAQSQANEQLIDVSGMLVVPGLVDLHTHIFSGQDLGVDAPTVGSIQGTTTMVDAGSAGGHLLGALRKVVQDWKLPHVRSFVNLSSIGATSIRLQGELTGLGYCDPEVAATAIQSNGGFVIGIKVRASADVGGSDTVEALRRAREVADRCGVPLMAHMGPAPATSDEILASLREGDILTHCFTGFSDNAVTRSAESIANLREAVERGVVLDVGHGMSGFSFRTAADALEAGIPPSTISTDIHAYSLESAVGMPAVMSKFLALGMSLEDVLVRSTVAPARVAGLDAEGVGSLRAGNRADVAVLRLVEEETVFVDSFGNSLPGRQRLENVLTVFGGEVTFDAEGLAR